jgi:hypothetical protein
MLLSQLIKDEVRLGFPSRQSVPIGTLANGVPHQRLFLGKSSLFGVWDCADRPQSVTDERRSSVFRGEPNTKMSAVPIAQTGNALSKADLNTEFPRFLRGRSNQNADQNPALGSKGAIA